MKDIIINGTILDTKPTGLGIYTLNIINQLSLSKRRCTLFTSINYNSNDQIHVTKITKFVRPYPYKKLGGILRFLINQTYFTILAKRYNLAYLPTPHGSIFLKNQVVTVHDLLALHFPKQHKLQYYYYKFFLPFILKNAKCIISISESTKQDLIKFYNLSPQKIKVVHNGFDRNNFTYKADAKEYIEKKYNLKNFIFTVGSSYPHKNIDRLIKAFKDLDNQDLKLAITGHIGENQKKIISTYDIKNVIFLGYIDSDDLPYFYSAATLMVYPSLYEGFGFPPLEAMSCNCPVVVSNTSSLPEVCGDAVEYINPYNISSITHGIMKVIKDDEYRNHIIQKGHLQVCKFSWEQTSQDIIEVFNESEHE